MTAEHVMRADALLVPVDVTGGQVYRVARVLAGHAKDAAELREWLEMLGFLPSQSAAGKYRAEQAPLLNAYRRPGH